METYGKILLIAMPVFLVLVLLEKRYGLYKGNDTVRQMDMISSLKGINFLELSSKNYLV